MSRKRFIKLMMAAGYSRNFAAACALRVLEWGSYEVAYTKLRDFDPSLPYLSELIRRAMQKVVVAFRRIYSDGEISRRY